MASVANIVRFLPASGSTGDFVYSSGVTGYRTPVSSPALTDGATYRYRAESSDLSEWEIGEGTWTTSTTTLARTTIIHSSTGAKVNFTTAPNVAIVALADQFINPAGDTMTGALVVPNASGLKIKDTDASHTLGLVGGSNLTADRTLTLTTGDASRTLDISAGNVTISSSGAALIDDASTAAQRSTLGLASSTTTGRLARYSSADGQTGQTTGLFEDGSGNVGIGTTTPGSALDVLGADENTISIANSGDTSNKYTIGRDTATGYLFTAGTQTSYSGYQWRVNGTTDVFIINNSGNVGIGTTSPSTTLHVNGPVRCASYTVATLPSASTVGAGARAFVTDANSTTFNATAASGGSNKMPVVSDGSIWKIG